MTTPLADKNGVREAYFDVRNDDSETNWVVLRYEGKDIVLDSTGAEYCDFQSKFQDMDRGYGYIRLISGDELSKRSKFAFVTWMGPNLGALKRGKMSTDKAFVKEVLQSFAVEINSTEIDELDENHIRTVIQKAGGANYGTGTRD